MLKKCGSIKKKKWNHAHTYTWYVNEKNEMHNKCIIKDVMEM